MKNYSIFALFFFLLANELFGHEQFVHQAITANAAETAWANSPAYESFLNTIRLDLASTDATNIMVIGSFEEDDDPKRDPVGGYRSLNHFYDPTKNPAMALTEQPPPLPAMPLGRDSFTWASVSNGAGLSISYNKNTMNIWSWQNAREYEWVGLTAANKSDRTAALTNMFRAVGQVMHLLEDASQPQHVRNEQHLSDLPGILKFIPSPWHSPIERYGLDHISQLNYGDGSMLDWRGVGFTKLEDFWDRHLYNGNSAALDDAETGGTQLGLAEWCNGNFLGARHLYPEYFKLGDIEYYPFPSRNHSTDYNAVKANPLSGLRDLTLNGHQGKGIYLHKNADGVDIQYVSRVNYLGAKIPGLTGPVYCTIADDNVLSNYHDILIPKAVQYSAGLLDYYFRGQLAVTVNADTNASQLTFTNINISGETFTNGMFFLYQEEASGNRTLLQQSSLGATNLENGESFVMNCTNTIGTNVTLIVIYQGTIGVANGAASDPVDAGIAIAVKKFWPYSYKNEEFIYKQWDSSCYNYLVGTYDVPAGIITSPISVTDANDQAHELMEQLYPTPIICN